MKKISPEELVHMYQETDKQNLKNVLFKAIKNRFSKSIRTKTKFYNTIYGIENEECVSIMLLSLFRAITTFDSSKNTKFITYYYNCIKNYMRNYIRDYMHVKCNDVRMYYVDDYVNIADEIPDPHAESVQDGFVSDIKKIIKQLPPIEQKVFLNYVYRDVGFKEIGESLGLTRQRANQIYTSAVDKIKRKYIDGK